MYKYLALLLTLTSCRQDSQPVEKNTANAPSPSIDSTAILKAAREADSIFVAGLQQLKAVDKVEMPPLELQIDEVKATKRWKFDRYPGNQRVEIPDSGYVFLQADISIVAITDNPMLPAICLYKVGKQHLEIVDVMTWMFYGWESEQAYLGNVKDESNMLGPGRSVRFSPGMAAPEHIMDNTALVLVMQKSVCMHRIERPIDNPPLFYDMRSCRAKATLSLKELEQNYAVLKVFNRDKL